MVLLHLRNRPEAGPLFDFVLFFFFSFYGSKKIGTNFQFHFGDCLEPAINFSLVWRSKTIGQFILINSFSFWSSKEDQKLKKKTTDSVREAEAIESGLMNASNQGFRNQQKGQKERKKERNNGKRVQSRQHVLSQRKSVAFVLSLASLSLSLSLRREDADQKTMEPLTHSQTHTHTHTHILLYFIAVQQRAT